MEERMEDIWRRLNCQVSVESWDVTVDRLTVSVLTVAVFVDA
jgi:hypothetical protein